MKTSRYTEAQIIAILRQAEGGVPVAELCREHGMSNASFYKWRPSQAVSCPDLLRLGPMGSLEPDEFGVGVSPWSSD